MPAKKSPPKYRLHKARNSAVVTIDGRNHYLGPYGSPKSHELYARLIAQRQNALDLRPQALPRHDDQLTIAELSVAYWRFANGYYRKEGEPTGELTVVKPALRALNRLYASSRVVDFGPLALQALQQHLIAADLARTYINGQVRRI
ncbi:MAG TPA: site-specific integrase, partial [Pirellulales bacterium]|nr:site-specific integrase [Pirellulales bacterium]